MTRSLVLACLLVAPAQAQLRVTDATNSLTAFAYATPFGVDIYHDPAMTGDGTLSEAVTALIQYESFWSDHNMISMTAWQEAVVRPDRIHVMGGVRDAVFRVEQADEGAKIARARSEFSVSFVVDRMTQANLTLRFTDPPRVRADDGWLQQAGDITYSLTGPGVSYDRPVPNTALERIEYPYDQDYSSVTTDGPMVLQPGLYELSVAAFGAGRPHEGPIPFLASSYEIDLAIAIPEPPSWLIALAAVAAIVLLVQITTRRT